MREDGEMDRKQTSAQTIVDVLALVTPTFSIGCTQFLNRVHSVVQSGALSCAIGRVRFFERLWQPYSFCELFGGFR